MINTAVRYVIDRAKEPSTWRGLVLIATASGAVIAPQAQEAIVTGGLFLAGLIGAALPDRKTGTQRE
jgi:hypothetical protein